MHEHAKILSVLLSEDIEAKKAELGRAWREYKFDEGKAIARPRRSEDRALSKEGSRSDIG
jgi:hypothetical protein